MHKLYYLFAVLCSLCFFSSLAQTGNIAGKIIDESSNQPLAGAVIIIQNISARKITEADGSYNFNNVEAGKYTLQISYVGYETKKIVDAVINKGEVTTLNVALAQQKNNLSDVVVTTTSAKKESLNSLLVTRKNAAVVSDGISADLIRKSPDKNTSDVLKRISGTTVQENKFVVVRGMNDRYNEAMLNGILLPSSEPDRKTFAFDIFPSEVVDNITIYKSASPDLPGSFAGGLVQINTKDVPDRKFFALKLTGGFNSITVKNDFYTYSGSKTDWLGFDNKVRVLPEGVTNYTPQKFNALVYDNPDTKTSLDKSFKNTWESFVRSGTPLNTGVQLTGGFNANLSKNTYPKFGGIFGVTYNSNFLYNQQELSSYGDANAVQYHYLDSIYNQSILESALGNLSFRINANHKIYFSNIVSVNSSDQTIIRGGSSEAVSRPFIHAYSYFFVSNRIWNSQVGGDHFFPKIKLKIRWVGYYTDLKREEPDYRFLVYQKQSQEDRYNAVIAFGPISSTESGLRYFGSVKDYSKGVNIDFNLPFKLLGNNQIVKAGAGYYYDDRRRTIRYFNTVANPTELSFASLYEPPGEIFQPSNFDAAQGLFYYEPELASNNYNGYVRNNTAFLMLDNKFAKKLRLVWGIRLEDYRNVLNIFDASSLPVKVDIKKEDWLPSANFIYSVFSKANFRASYGRTVARPLFRELAPQIFYDFLYNITYSGNPSLVPSYIDNYEIRWEHFFNNSQYYSISGFYKKFKNPIEQNVVNPSAESLFVNFVNTPDGKTQGIELEARKDFSFISRQLESLIMYVNVAFIKSEVSTENINNAKTGSRPLFGQSPYIINTSLQYTEPKSNLSASVLYNQAGTRLFLTGGYYDDIIWEKPRPILDFKVSKPFLKNKGIVEFSWGDILHKSGLFFNDLNGNKKWDGDETDRKVIDRKFGYTMSLALGYRF